MGQCFRTELDTETMAVETRLAIAKARFEQASSVSMSGSGGGGGGASHTAKRLSIAGEFIVPPPVDGEDPNTTGKRILGSLHDDEVDWRISCEVKDLERAGIQELFSRGHLGGKRALFLMSTLDKAQGRRASFKEKDEEVLLPEGSAEGPEELVAWLKSLGVGWACKKGLKPMSPNQDSFSILAVEDTFLLIGVYDGHGPKGHDISQFAREALVRIFVADAERHTDPEGALVRSFLQAQQEIEEAKDLASWESGCTGTAIYLDYRTRKLSIAHVGDGRCVLGLKKTHKDKWVSEDMTQDHKPNLPEERKRIESANPPGRVLFDGSINHRVYVKEAMYPGLAMSRALGDVLAHKRCGLTAHPDTRTVDVSKLLEGSEEATLLVCSDGVWEFISGDEAFQLIDPHLGQDTSEAMNMLALKSWDKWMEDSHESVSDDITAICIPLHRCVGPRVESAAKEIQ